MRELRVAAVQLTSTADVESNLRRACDLTAEAAAAGAQLVALPENFGLLGREEEKVPHAQGVDDGPFLEGLRGVARDQRIWVLAGSIPERGPDPARTYNTSVLIDPDGRTVAAYRKIHLFDVDLADGTSIAESRCVAPGEDPVLTSLGGWGVGLSVCYDLRFPELYRLLAQQGAELLTVPAAFTLHTGKDHWDLLLRARAVENQCFVIAPAQFGHHGNRRSSWGKSQIIDPWGTQLAVAAEREGFVLATLVRDDLDRVRRELPALGHRRL